MDKCYVGVLEVYENPRTLTMLDLMEVCVTTNIDLFYAGMSLVKSILKHLPPTPQIYMYIHKRCSGKYGTDFNHHIVPLFFSIYKFKAPSGYLVIFKKNSLCLANNISTLHNFCQGKSLSLR